MVFKRFYDDNLAQASYLIGCGASGEAVVIDPNRDASQYVAAAKAEGLKIVAVTETHIHADYLSGSRELAAVTGAQLYLSGEGGPDWQYEFAKSDGAKLLHDGETFRVGAVQIQARHTPGHTPEHLTFLVTDTASSDTPVAALTGDFVFAGDVGRPDLLENAAGLVGTMEPGARDLYRSISAFKREPEFLLLWPGHGAGSACGKALGGSPVTTLGYELRTNWAMRSASEASFVGEVLSGQPEPPNYFAMMKRLNKEGPAILGERSIPALSGAGALKALMAEGATVIDLRSDEEFRRGFVPGTVNIPGAWKSFVNYAGWVVPYGPKIALIAASQADAERAANRLSLIGLDAVCGWFPTGVVAESGGLQTIGEADINAPDQGVTWLDVRSKAEWSRGHVPGSINVTLGKLREHSSEIPRDKPLAVYCQSGGRSAVGASILKGLGFEDVLLSPGGFDAYRAASIPDR